MNQHVAPKWTVYSQQETARPVAGGQVVRGILVTFRLVTGESGTVFIPDEQYQPEYVRAAISERAAQMQAVRNLTG